GIQHRDFKSLNVLLDDYLHCKVSDFGLSKSRTTMQTTSHALGNANERAMATLAWTAPERLKIGSRFTDKCDVYSFGVTLYEIASRSLPFEGEEALVIRMSILEGARPEIPDDAPEAFAALICECWAQEARLRPGFEEITRRL
ncbi:kinase-like domain-containing protein, partial [Blastocladiella britannica]